jgi:hypothetical protein
MGKVWSIPLRSPVSRRHLKVAAKRRWWCLRAHTHDTDTERKYNLAAKRFSVTGCWTRRGADFNISLQNHKQTSHLTTSPYASSDHNNNNAYPIPKGDPNNRILGPIRSPLSWQWPQNSARKLDGGVWRASHVSVKVSIHEEPMLTRIKYCQATQTLRKGYPCGRVSEPTVPMTASAVAMIFAGQTSQVLAASAPRRASSSSSNSLRRYKHYLPTYSSSPESPPSPHHP